MKISDDYVKENDNLTVTERKIKGFHAMTGVQVALFSGKDSVRRRTGETFLDCSCLRGLLQHNGQVVLAQSACGLLYGMVRNGEECWIAGPVLTSREKMQETADFIIRNNCREDGDASGFSARISSLPVMSAENFEYCLVILACAVSGKDISEIDCGCVVQKNILLFPGQSRKDQEDDGRLEECVEYIRSNINESLSLTSIAKFCGYNPAYLSRKFKKVYGINMNRFILETKLSAAADYLKNSDKPLCEISEDLCFASQSHFQNAFKNVYRVTPLEFRRQRKKMRNAAASVGAAV